MELFEPIVDGLGYSAAELLLLTGVVAMASFVRGICGFGTALIYLPLATTVLDPVTAIAVMVIFDAVGPIPLIPRALRDANRRHLAGLTAGVIVMMPLGVWLLTKLDPTGFQWMVSILALTMLAALLGGWRYQGAVTLKSVVGIGAAGGFLGGFAGLPGPPVILFYLSGQAQAAAIRANTLLYLVVFDVLALAVFFGGALVSSTALWLGLAMVPISMIAGLIGQRAFNPLHEKRYRITAYAVIAASAVVGLPIW